MCPYPQDYANIISDLEKTQWEDRFQTVQVCPPVPLSPGHPGGTQD